MEIRKTVPALVDFFSPLSDESQDRSFLGASSGVISITNGILN